ncbi:MAG: YchJ family metal-binding protein [Xanthomonadaceae bacterium]|nr:YchJ family metal-binding protein [Xanthomonadaceae bacterium]
MRRSTLDHPPCPCGRPLPYAQCCAPLHKGSMAGDAESLMRSRYSAYVLADTDYLLATWHPATRPDRLDADPPGLAWLGLDIKRTWSDDPDRAGVEFIARYRIGGAKAQRLHERSRFVREAGRWFYLDAEGDI